MTHREYPRIGEQVYHHVLENGLNIFVFPKPEHGKSYAFFATNYGGMDMRFELDGQKHDTPAGVAHFLEHKMFDTEDGNALQDLASNGASPNAFTSNAITGYYFESTEKFEKNLRILLSFVSVPWFTKESVDKEQGIIAQEIRMIEDNPDWSVFINMMQGLYANHPVRTSVAGTVESISHITADTLYACHKAFYDPSNMVLCVAGNVQPELVCDIARQILPPASGHKVSRDYGQPEPVQAACPLTQVEMEVSAPIFQIACKGDGLKDGPETLRIQLLGELAVRALIGSSSVLYAKLYEQGLINGEFDCGCEQYPGCVFLYAGGESRDPKLVLEQFRQEARRLIAEGIDEALWRRLKKAAYGERVRNLNSFENLCVGQAQAFFSGADSLSFPELFDTVTAEDARLLLERWVVEDRITLSVVQPKGGSL
ncbi:MAG: insulinase family protein [Oscillospiraceae bacterium]|nr:insulinase family protein [Oscillospiraceae bacterium]